MRNVLLVSVILGLVGQVFGDVLFQDAFEGETAGAVAANWTSTSSYAPPTVANEGGDYGQVLNTTLWSSTQKTYTINSNDSFGGIDENWTLTFDLKNYQQWAQWSYTDIVRTPGNFVLRKDQYRAISVYDSAGNLLGTTNNALNTEEIWTRYSIVYENGILAVSATNVNGTTSGIFNNVTPDYSTPYTISFGLFVCGGGRSWTKIDNVLLSTEPSATFWDGATINIVDYARDVMLLDPSTIDDWQPVVAAAIDSNRRLYFPPGTYPIKQTILIYGKTSFCLDGNSAEIVWHPDCVAATNAMIWIRFCHDSLVRGLSLDGRCPDHLNGSYADGLSLDQSSHITVRNCRVRNIRSDGLVLAQSTQCKIENNRIEDCGTNGILAGYSSDGSFPSADYNVIRGNIVCKTYYQNGIFVTADFGSQETSKTVYGTIITDNTVENAADIGIESSLRCVGSVVANNSVTNSGNMSILLVDNRDSIVTGNTCSMASGSGVEGNITVKHWPHIVNKITDAHVLVANNVISGGKNAGLIVQNVDWVTVENNSFTDVGGHGMRLLTTSHSTFSGNTMSNQKSIGIAVYCSMTGVDINGNTMAMTDSGSTGLYISFDNTLTNCSIKSNSVLGSCMYSYRAISPLTVVNSEFSDNTYPENQLPVGFDGFVVTEAIPQVPVFVPGGHYISGPTQISIICVTPGANIYYTTNGDEPTTGSTLYAGPVMVNDGMTLRAKAVASGGASSTPASVTYAVSSSYDRPGEIFWGSVVVDGDLSDWAGISWNEIDQLDDGNPTDVIGAYYAAKWQANKVYVAVKVRDTSHGLTDGYTGWADSDAIEIYLHTDSIGPDNYPYCESAQQYRIGINASGTDTVWTAIGNAHMNYVTGILDVPSTAEFAAAGVVDGDWLIYEVAMTPFTHFGAISGNGANVATTLHGNDVIGLDVKVVANDGTDIPGTEDNIPGYTGRKAENSDSLKSVSWSQFGLHKLVSVVVGDANGDGAVDVGDLGILAANYGVSSGATRQQGDFNGDGAVDVGDLGILAANYGLGVSGEVDFDADYAEAFGLSVDEDDAANDETAGSLCSGLGLPLIVGLLFMGLMLVKSRE